MSLHSAMSDSSVGGGRRTMGATLVFQDVSVVIGKKLILNKVSGVAKVGEMLAIMGPSGMTNITFIVIPLVYHCYTSGIPVV